MNILAAVFGIINPSPVIQHDSDDNIYVPLEFENAVDGEDSIQVGEPVYFIDEVGRVYPGVLIEKKITKAGGKWGLVHYQYEWNGVQQQGYSWQPSVVIWAADDWNAQFKAVAS